MVKSGALEAIYLHLASLRNLKDLTLRLGHEADVPEGKADDDVTRDETVNNGPDKAQSSREIRT
jgi:hypothetical protein